MKLHIFSTPLAETGVLRHDAGWTSLGFPGTFKGRPCISFEVPAGTPNGNGCRIELSTPLQVKIEFRGLLWINDGILAYPWSTGQEVALEQDDCYFQDEKICPPCPEPEPIPPPGNRTPRQIIDAVYMDGDFDLSTHDGCGEFTEACCTALHEEHSVFWGHIKKNPGQNQYNGHAVDALMLLQGSQGVQAAIYDIVKNSVSPDAELAFNKVDTVKPELWYYPA